MILMTKTYDCGDILATLHIMMDTCSDRERLDTYNRGGTEASKVIWCVALSTLHASPIILYAHACNADLFLQKC